MRRLSVIVLAFLAFSAFSFAQEEKESYTMFENTRMVVKTDKFKEFSEAMADHNKKYHSDGANHANLWMVSVGANAGQFVWSMGPCTYSDLDNRPSGKDHMEDWMYNVMPNVKYIKETNYWKLDEKSSYMPEGVNNTKLSIRIFDIEDYQSYRFKELMAKVIKVYTDKNYEWTLGTYWSEFDIHEDEDVAIVWGFDKWAWFDRDPQFKADFEEIHGENSWWKFLEELRGTIKSAKDEVWEIIPELSGDME